MLNYKAMTNLEMYGWNNRLDQQKQKSIHKALFHGRIAIVHRTCYEVVSEGGIFQCELTGSLLFGKSTFELPCVGDWVIFQAFDDDKGIIVEMLSRERTLYRKKSGTVADRQAIASYVDKAFIVQSLDGNFNVRRIERFLVQIAEAGIEPILVLNKADLSFDKESVDEAIGHLVHRMPVYFTSIHQPQTIRQIRESISRGETVIFVGSSGVGKSSLVNALCERPVLATSDISFSTGKGRHTSTRREMVLMDNSGILIDTPGVREFGLAIDDPDSLTEIMEFSDIAESCRFKDCEHINEPGCAILEAVNKGTLDRKIYESYIKLRKEAWHFSASEHEKRKREKSFSKILEEVKQRKADF